MLKTIEQPAARRATALSAAARVRMVAHEKTPFLHGDWVRSLFMHYEVDPAAIAPLVPFELNLRDGRAYVTLVAFHMQNMRPHCGGTVAAWLSRPVANHRFFNVRTYVVRDGEPGVFFLAEWISSAINVFLGPRAFGLPYRHGKLAYEHDTERGIVQGTITGKGGDGACVRYRTPVDAAGSFEPCDTDSLDEFLLERYTAYTERRGVRRRFRVWHQPWPVQRVTATVEESSLLAQTGNWFEHATAVGAHYSPGVLDVHMGRPQCISGPHCEQHWPGSA